MKTRRISVRLSDEDADILDRMLAIDWADVKNATISDVVSAALRRMDTSVRMALRKAEPSLLGEEVWRAK